MPKVIIIRIVVGTVDKPPRHSFCLGGQGQSLAEGQRIVHEFGTIAHTCGKLHEFIGSCAGKIGTEGEQCRRTGIRPQVIVVQTEVVESVFRLRLFGTNHGVWTAGRFEVAVSSLRFEDDLGIGAQG